MNENIFFDYIFPLPSPFEGDYFYIFDFIGNIVSGWGGVWKDIFSAPFLLWPKFFSFIFPNISLFDIWNGEISFFLNIYKVSKNLVG